VLLHGSSTSSLSFVPLVEHLESVRAIAVDRPGFGLSEPAHVPRERFRDAAVEFLDEVVDELQLETSALAGNSMGGTWASGMRSRGPNAFLGSCWLGPPLLPGTRPPAPCE
jgi:pimeloyl-ACP methyl ester carboxylesterase